MVRGIVNGVLVACYRFRVLHFFRNGVWLLDKGLARFVAVGLECGCFVSRLIWMTGIGEDGPGMRRDVHCSRGIYLLGLPDFR